MALGIVLKGFPIANVNGSYTPLSHDVIGTNIVWEAVDKLYRIRYKPLDPIYEPTHDETFVVGKDYYKLVDNEYVYDSDSHRATDIISDYGIRYEQKEIGQWEVVPMENGTPSNEYVFSTIIDNEAILPYDSDNVWKDSEGIVVKTASLDFWDESSFRTTTSEPVVDEKNGTVTTVVTTTNIITGDVYKETSVVRTKDVFVQKTLVRYDDVNTAVGKAYKFKFSSDFKEIGFDPSDETQADNAGVFTIDKIIKYSDIVTSGIDLYANLYQPLGIKKEMYTADLPRIKDSLIYKLIDPTDNSKVIYMPQIFVQEADPSVEKYNKLLLAIDLGVHGDDPDLMQDIEYTLSQLFAKKWGIVAQEGNKLATVTIYDNVWLTTSQKEKIESVRNDIRKTTKISLSDLFDLQETNQFFIENRRLKGRVEALEEIITNNRNR